jgi:G3E family GTPase
LDGETVVMAAGCLCCTIRDDLAATLVSLHHRRESGAVPPYDRIIIETTGLADPAPIAQLLLTHPDVIDHHHLAGLVSTLDGRLGQAQLADTPECVKQIAMADAVVLSKTDMPSAETEALRATVQTLNPGVVVVLAREATSDIITTLGRPEAMDLAALTAGDIHGHPGHHHHGINRHAAGIQAVPLVIEEPQDWMSLSMWLSFIITTHGEHLLRLKGVVNIAGEPGPIVINGVRHIFHEPAHLPTWPDADRRTRLVFILKDLEPTVILESWREFAAAG